jgi:chromosome segregation ATPase
VQRVKVTPPCRVRLFDRCVDVCGNEEMLCGASSRCVLLFVEKKMDDLGGQLTNEIHQLDAKIEQVKNDIELLDTRIGQVKNDIELLDTRIGQVKNDIELLDTRIGQVKNDIELLNTKIESHIGSPLLLEGYLKDKDVLVEERKGYGEERKGYLKEKDVLVEERKGYVEERKGYVATRALLRDAVVKAKIGRMGQQSLNDGL